MGRWNLITTKLLYYYYSYDYYYYVTVTLTDAP